MLEIAMIGAGAMGSHHARVARQVSNTQISLVVDSVPQRAKALAEAVGCRWATDTSTVPRHAQAAIVATPSQTHVAVAEPLLRQGLPLLVEKPLALSLAGCSALIEASRLSGAALQVAHVERFNPAFAELRLLVREVIHVSARRISPFSDRSSDGVISDLMIHDLDLVRTLISSEVVSVSGVARSTRTNAEDIAVASLTFASGVTASLTASRIGQQKIRRMDVTQADSSVSVDLLKQSVTVHRFSDVQYVIDGGVTLRQSGVIEVPYLDNRGEPLARQLESFVQSVLAGQAVAVPGEDGMAAVEMCLRVDRAVRRS